MGLFYREDSDYNLSHRMKGFNRYKQLLSFYAFRWVKVNLITTAGAIPLAAAITWSILTSSILYLIPLSFAGGMIFGPFLSGLFDSLLRGFRDAPGKWHEHYRRSWKQNWKCSLIPGGLFGLITGMYCFMIYMMWNAQVFPGWGTICLFVFSALLFLVVVNLYWIQMVLFSQTVKQRLINIILFTSKYLWKVLSAALYELVFVALIVLFFPYTLIIVPFLGFWYITFLVIFRIYTPLDESFHIEEQLKEIEGDPWAPDYQDIYMTLHAKDDEE